jgi:hypothetical protein
MKKLYTPGPGRPAGLKNQLALQVLKDMSAIYSEPAKFQADAAKLTKGQEAILSLYRREPREFVKQLLSLIPRELTIENAIAGASDEEMQALLAELRARRARLVEAASTEDVERVH